MVRFFFFSIRFQRNAIPRRINYLADRSSCGKPFAIDVPVQRAFRRITLWWHLQGRPSRKLSIIISTVNTWLHPAQCERLGRLLCRSVCILTWRVVRRNYVTVYYCINMWRMKRAFPVWLWNRLCARSTRAISPVKCGTEKVIIAGKLFSSANAARMLRYLFRKIITRSRKFVRATPKSWIRLRYRSSTPETWSKGIWAWGKYARGRKNRKPPWAPCLGLVKKQG